MEKLLREHLEKHLDKITAIRNFEDVLAKLHKFYELHINASLNLTSIKDEEEFYLKHYLDSIYPFFVIDGLRNKINSHDKSKSFGILDVGSGGGFPGIVLAIFFPFATVYLNESIQKKCNFLEDASIKLGLSNTIVLNSRVEALTEKELTKGVDILTTRGVSSVIKLLKLTGNIKRKNKSMTSLLYKGEQLKAELDEAGFTVIEDSVNTNNEYNELTYKKTKGHKNDGKEFASSIIKTTRLEKPLQRTYCIID